MAIISKLKASIEAMSAIPGMQNEIAVINALSIELEVEQVGAKKLESDLEAIEQRTNEQASKLDEDIRLKKEAFDRCCNELLDLQSERLKIVADGKYAMQAERISHQNRILWSAKKRKYIDAYDYSEDFNKDAVSADEFRNLREKELSETLERHEDEKRTNLLVLRQTTQAMY